MAAASIEEIQGFLLDVKMAIVRKKISLVRRKENLECLAKHGWSIDDILFGISALTYRNYISGPEEDDDPRFNGDIWKFGHIIDGTECYIKIKLVVVKDGELLVCLSFHEPIYEMRYPYKGPP